MTTMTLHRAFRLTTLLAALVTLAGCGGGDDGDTTPGGGPLTYPSSGAYGWTLKASGSTSALKHGLSLVHPSLPDNEYVIETASESITDTRLVLAGTVNPSQLSASSIQPHALVYIFGGDVRSVSMQANGSPPSTIVKRSNTSSACRFVLAANDYATPDSSRFIVSTAGADGRCDTTDDGRAEVRLGAGTALGYTVIAADPPLEVARDPATLAPRGWIYPRHVELWGTTPVTRITTRATGTTAVSSVIANTYQSALVDDGSRLSVLSFASGNTVLETPLDTTLTAGGNWRLIGFDADNFYVYRSSESFTEPLTVLKITRVNPIATVLASGTGLVSVTSMGSNVLYLTVFTTTDNRLVRISKASGAVTQTTYPIDVKPTVQTSANGRHQLWLVTDVGSADVSYAISIIDENGGTLYTGEGGFPISVAQPSVENFNASESRTRFIFAQGFGTRAFGDASLVSYDAMTDSAKVLGALPGTADYGNDFVFASAVGGPGSFGVGFATRSSNGSYADQDAKVFSYDLATAGSMKITKNK